MTRKEAIDAVLAQGLQGGLGAAGKTVDILVALGVLKLEDPAPPMRTVEVELLGGNTIVVSEAAVLKAVRSLGWECCRSITMVTLSEVASFSRTRSSPKWPSCTDMLFPRSGITFPLADDRRHR